MIEQLVLEGTMTIHLVHPPSVSRDIFSEIRLLSVPSNLTLSVSRLEASTMSLGNDPYYHSHYKKILFYI